MCSTFVSIPGTFSSTTMGMIAGVSAGGLLCCCGLFFGGFLVRRKLKSKNKNDRIHDEDPSSPTTSPTITTIFGGKPQSPPGSAMIKSPLPGSDKLLRKRASTMRTNDTTPTSKGDDEESMNDGLFVTPSTDGRSSFAGTM